MSNQGAIGCGRHEVLYRGACSGFIFIVCMGCSAFSVRRRSKKSLAAAQIAVEMVDDTSSRMEAIDCAFCASMCCVLDF